MSGDDAKVLLSNNEVIRFNKELVGAFQDIIEQIDQSQIQSINSLGQR